MRALLPAALIALSVGVAHAADAPAMTPVEPPVALPAGEPTSFDWSGVYAGGTLGYGWVNADQSPPSPFPSYGVPTDGLIGGVVAGANFQHNTLVFGVEGDFSWTDISGDIVPDPQHASATTASVDIDWIASVRGRVGFAFDRTLLYGTGGIAFAHANADVTNFYGNGDNRTADATHFGWTAGGGGEFAVGSNLTFRAEYLYYDFLSETYSFTSNSFPSPVNVDASGTGQVARFGFNYIFH